MCKCLKSCGISMLKYCILILIPGLLFLFYYIVNYIPITIPKKEASKINVSNYIPDMYGAVLTYITSPDNKQVRYYNKQIIKAYNLSINNDAKKLFYIYNYNGIKEGSLTSIKSIEVQDNSITALSTNNLHEDTSPDEIHLSTNPKWRISETKEAYLTKKDLTIETLAGKFSDCLEITVIESLDNGERNYQTFYFTPKIGYIMKKSGKSMKNQEKVYELYSYSLPESKLKNASEVNNFISNYLPLSGSTLSSSKYNDENLGISFTLPKYWIGNVKIDNSVWADNIEHSTSFFLNIDNNSFQRIFSISMFKKGYDKNYIDKIPHLQYIGESKGRSLAYSTTNYYSKETFYDTSLYRRIHKMASDTKAIIKSISKL